MSTREEPTATVGTRPAPMARAAELLRTQATLLESSARMMVLLAEMMEVQDLDGTARRHECPSRARWTTWRGNVPGPV